MCSPGSGARWRKPTFSSPTWNSPAGSAARRLAMHLAVDEHATLAQWLGVEHGLQAEHRRQRDAASLRFVHRGRDVACGEEACVLGGHLRCVGAVQRPALATLVEPGEHRFGVAGQEQDDAHEAVSAPVRRVRDGAPGTELLGDRQHGVGRLHHRLVQRQLEVLPVARVHPVPQPDQREVRRHHATDVVGDASRRQQRRSPGDPAQRQHAAQCEQDGIARLVPAVGTWFAERLDRHDDEVRPCRTHRLHVERGAGVDPHIGTAEQVEQLLLALGRRCVEDDGALVGVAQREAEARPADDRRKCPSGTPAGRLDEDHFGAEVGEEAAGEVGGVVGGVDDAHSAQRSGAHGVTPRLDGTSAGPARR